MTAVRIPLAAKASQVLAIQLGQQSCRIRVFQKRTGLYLDLYVNDAAVALGVLCRDRVWLVRMPDTAFIGDLAFFDQQGTDDPSYDGIADRFHLVWSA